MIPKDDRERRRAIGLRRTVAGVRYEHWLRFAMPLYGLLLGLGAVASALGIGVGLR